MDEYILIRESFKYYAIFKCKTFIENIRGEENRVADLKELIFSYKEKGYDFIEYKKGNIIYVNRYDSDHHLMFDNLNEAYREIIYDIFN